MDVQQQQIVQSHENLRKILQARWCAAAADNSGSLRRNPSSKVFAELFLIPWKSCYSFFFPSSSSSFVSVWFWAPPSPLPPSHNVWSYCIANPGDFQLDCRATWVFVNGVPAGMANARCCDKHNTSSSSQSKRQFNPPPPKKRSTPWFCICVRSLASSCYSILVMFLFLCVQINISLVGWWGFAMQFSSWVWLATLHGKKMGN